MNSKLLVPLVILLVLPSLVSAADYYVDSDSSCTSGCGGSWTTAWQSFSDIQWGSVGGGDIIYISGGSTSKTYNEKLSVGASGSSSNPLIITKGQGDGHNGEVIIDRDLVDRGISVGSHDYVIIKDMTTVSEGIRMDGSTGTIIENMKIRYRGAHGGIWMQNSDAVTIRNNDIRTVGCLDGQMDGFYGQYSDNLIFEGNTVVMSANFCLGGGKPHADSFQLANDVNNVIVRNNWFELDTECDECQMIVEDLGGRNLFYNNVILGSRGQPWQTFLAKSSTSVVEFYNNVVVAQFDGSVGSTDPSRAIAVRASNSQNKIRNNIIICYAGTESQCSGIGSATESNNIYGDFSDLAAWLDSDYRPLPGSPPIDFGTDLSEIFDTDMEGVQRIGLWDAGPYEYGTIPCTTASECPDKDCNTATCPVDECVYTSNTASCNDGNECTNLDTCDGAGTCSGTPITGDCTDDLNECTNDVCSGGSCTHPPVADETSCSGSGHCCSGDCDTTTDNTGYNINCRSGPQCNGQSWEYVAANEGTICSGECQTCSSGYCTDDNGVCSGGDICSSGTCTGCISNSDCNDGVACTNDVCSVGSCTNTLNNDLCPDEPGCTSKTCTLTGCDYDPPGCETPCPSSTSSWQNTQFSQQTGTFTAEFDATPDGTDIDCITALSPSDGSDYPDYAILIRFYYGVIEARNGDEYTADSVIPYTAGTKYHFRVEVVVPANTYSVFMTPDGGSEVTVGTDYAFRTEQQGTSELNYWGLRSEQGSHEVCNFQIGSGQQTYHRADLDHSCDIDIDELMVFMNRWKVSIADVGMVEMMEAIELWKARTGC